MRIISISTHPAGNLSAIVLAIAAAQGVEEHEARRAIEDVLCPPPVPMPLPAFEEIRLLTAPVAPKWAGPRRGELRVASRKGFDPVWTGGRR